MAEELKDQRVVTMMSGSELERIDDWMFKNRLRSRGEAIRRLCQIGIIAGEQELLKLALHTLAHYMKDEDHGKTGETFASGDTLEADVKRLFLAIVEERSKMGGFTSGKPIEEAIATAKRLTDDYSNARNQSPFHKGKTAPKT